MYSNPSIKLVSMYSNQSINLVSMYSNLGIKLVSVFQSDYKAGVYVFQSAQYSQTVLVLILFSWNKYVYVTLRFVITAILISLFLSSCCFNYSYFRV